MTKRSNDLLNAGFFLGPNFLGFLVFMAAPLVTSFVLAFTNWSLAMSNQATDPLLRPAPPAMNFVGLNNFIDLVTDNTFWLYFLNTIYLMLGIPIGIAGSLVLALLLNKPLRENTWLGKAIHGGIAMLCCAIIGAVILYAGNAGNDMFLRVLGSSVMLLGAFYCLGVFSGVVVYRTMFYLPSFVAGVAVYILWKNLYNGDFGPVALAMQAMQDAVLGAWNAVTGLFGAQPVVVEKLRPLASTRNLLALSSESPAIDPRFFGIGAREALIFMGLVTGIGGGNMLLYLAGLSNIPPELYEAADIDGANKWQGFWSVTWPQLAPTTFFIVVMSCIGGLQGGFDVARVMTGGGPAGTTTTLNYFIYTRAFEQGRLGYASAASWILFVMVFAVTLLNFRFGSRRVNE